MGVRRIVLVTDLRGSGPVALLRAALAAESVARLVQEGAAVTVVPVADGGGGEMALAERLEAMHREGVGVARPGTGHAGFELLDRPPPPGAALWSDAAVVIDALTVGDDAVGAAVLARPWEPGPALEVELAAARRLAGANRLGLVLGGPVDAALLDLLTWAPGNAAMIFVGGDAGLASVRARGGRTRRDDDAREAEVPARLAVAEARGTEVLAPVDLVVRLPGGEVRTVVAEERDGDHEVLDIGPRTGMIVAAALRRCDALLWRGVFGRWREPAFALGTRWVGEAQVGHLEGFRVAAGDETIAAAARFHQLRGLSFASPSGDAFVRLLLGGEYEDAQRALRSAGPLNRG